jgi:hypothetical protein
VAVAGGLGGFGFSVPCAFEMFAVNTNRLIILNRNKRFIVIVFVLKNNVNFGKSK